ncbi:TetR/AcrR family transcriptional regulator [Gammaproteobacteria bacterium AH-315-C21]|nr:TetR/AcrR family transcriptional regulator [Gammaproteobacteria bacterium AH-315-C21]
MALQRSQSDTLIKILDVAEARIRSNGFNDFSFRDIAADVGIKSASVHYHFPTKSDLGVGVTRRYTARFLHYLGDPEDKNNAPAELLLHYINGYKKFLIDDEAMCLCGMLGAELASLPEPVREEVKRFNDDNVEWLKRVYQRLNPKNKKKKAKTKAFHLLASMQGAMIIARTLNEPKLFDRISQEFLN